MRHPALGGGAGTYWVSAAPSVIAMQSDLDAAGTRALSIRQETRLPMSVKKASASSQDTFSLASF